MDAEHDTEGQDLMPADLRDFGRSAWAAFWQEKTWDTDRKMALTMAKVERSRAPKCPEVLSGAFRKPNAYVCQCGNTRMLHWQKTPCPRCGLNREDSNEKRLVDASVEDARKRGRGNTIMQIDPL